MTCLCLPRIQALIQGLAPVAALRVGVPPVMASLSAAIAMPAAPARALSLDAALQVGLPPLPLPLEMIERIAASATAVAQINAGLGIDLLRPQGMAQLSLAIGTMQARLPQLLPMLAALKLDLGGAMNLALTLSAIASARATFGIDLLSSGAALALKLALSARLGLPGAPMPVPPPMSAQLAAYARLGAAATAFGGAQMLLPSLVLLARLSLPSLAWPVGSLASLSLLLGLRENLKAVLGIDAALPDLQLKLQAALRPLWALASLQMPALGTSGAWSLPSLTAGLALEAQAIASLDLAAIANLKLPDLAPVSLIASLSAGAALASPGCCGGG